MRLREEPSEGCYLAIPLFSSVHLFRSMQPPLDDALHRQSHGSLVAISMTLCPRWTSMNDSALRPSQSSDMPLISTR